MSFITFEFDDNIAENILDYLGGWTIRSETEDNEDSQFIVSNLLTNDEYDQLDTAKTITLSEIERFYQKAYIHTKAYLNYQLPCDELEDVLDIILESIIMWSAGLLWRKYNIRVNDQTDDTPTIGYGDNLIIQAKTILNKYAYTNTSVW